MHVFSAFLVLKLLKLHSFHYIGWTKTVILMDLRRGVGKFSRLPWQSAKFDKLLTSILE